MCRHREMPLMQLLPIVIIIIVLIKMMMQESVPNICANCQIVWLIIIISSIRSSSTWTLDRTTKRCHLKLRLQSARVRVNRREKKKKKKKETDKNKRRNVLGWFSIGNPLRSEFYGLVDVYETRGYKFVNLNLPSGLWIHSSLTFIISE